MNKRYWISRICLVPITLLGILLINFVIIQMTPGGPMEHMMMKLRNSSNQTHVLFSQGSTISTNETTHDKAVGVNDDIKQEIKNSNEI